MIRAAFLRRMAFAALATALFEVRVPEVEDEGEGGPVRPYVAGYVWVDPERGADSAAGTAEAPFATVDRAMAAMPQGGGGTIVLLPGTHRGGSIYGNGVTIRGG